MADCHGVKFSSRGQIHNTLDNTLAPWHFVGLGIWQFPIDWVHFRKKGKLSLCGRRPIWSKWTKKRSLMIHRKPERVFASFPLAPPPIAHVFALDDASMARICCAPPDADVHLQTLAFGAGDESASDEGGSDGGVGDEEDGATELAEAAPAPPPQPPHQLWHLPLLHEDPEASWLRAGRATRLCRSYVDSWEGVGA